MTGWRIGYSVSNKAIADACDKLQSQITSGTCSITQRAGIAAYEGGLETIKEMREVFRRRRDLVYGLLKDIDGLKVNLPGVAFYFFPDVSSFFGKKTPEGEVLNNAQDIALYLLNTGHVAVVSGDGFGDPNSIRISYAAADDKLVEAVKRIKYAFEQLK